MTPARFFRDGSAACESSSGARRLTLMTFSKYSGVKSSSDARSEIAALLTRMSMPPHFWSVVSRMPCVCFTSRRSPSTKKESLPSVAARVRPRSWGMPVTTTRAPSRARLVAIAAPRPMQLPVTTATFPARDLLIAAPTPVLRELFPQELRALPQVVEADLDGRPFAVLDADPAVIARLRHGAEDAVVVVQAFSDHAVLHELRVAVLGVAGHPAQFLDRAAVEVAVGGLHGRDARHHAV